MHKPRVPEHELDPNFQWTRGDTLALAAHSCTNCEGLGLLVSDGKPDGPCHCVLRSIFRACLTRFRECVGRPKHLGRVSPGFTFASARKRLWERKDEEYVADFCLVSRRHLAPQEHRIFRYHFLLGADWRACCARLRMQRGNFFHAVYRIEQKLGRVFRQLQPYCLYPLSEYFHGARTPITACAA